MAKYELTLDKRTVEGRNVFDFLVGMQYVNEETPNVAFIDERSRFGKKVLDFLYAVGVVKSPYDPEYVAKIKQAERELEMGLGIEIKDINAL